jgi:hypothetical protein
MYEKYKKSTYFYRTGIFLLISCLFTACQGGMQDDGQLKQAKEKMEHFLMDYGNNINQARYAKDLQMYEFVVDGRQILYLDKTMRYMLLGDVIDIDNKENLTAKRALEISAVQFDELPFEQAIKVVKGNGQVKLAVFSDPDCPHCKQLEHTIAKIDNITVYYFLLPLENLHPDAINKSKHVWCQGEKRVQVWQDFMLKNKPIPQAAACDDPVEKNIALARQLGVNSTPTIFLENGIRIDGSVSNLAQILDQIRRSKK